uniref:Uncharacterized protein n=1 Tax=Anguilla anguilla TaxID=7936 RepID=A0A0E9V3G3_ANGAN
MLVSITFSVYWYNCVSFA